jgi:hypothetical protein
MPGDIDNDRPRNPDASSLADWPLPDHPKSSLWHKHHARTYACTRVHANGFLFAILHAKRYCFSELRTLIALDRPIRSRCVAPRNRRCCEEREPFVVGFLARSIHLIVFPWWRLIDPCKSMRELVISQQLGSNVPVGDNKASVRIN